MTKYIDADKLSLCINDTEFWDQHDKDVAMRCVQIAETADVQEVVRCKDCIHRDPEDKRCDGVFGAKNGLLPMDDDDYCSCGERKDGDEQ